MVCASAALERNIQAPEATIEPATLAKQREEVAKQFTRYIFSKGGFSCFF